MPAKQLSSSAKPRMPRIEDEQQQRPKTSDATTIYKRPPLSDSDFFPEWSKKRLPDTVVVPTGGRDKARAETVAEVVLTEGMEVKLQISEKKEESKHKATKRLMPSASVPLLGSKRSIAPPQVGGEEAFFLPSTASLSELAPVPPPFEPEGTQQPIEVSDLGPNEEEEKAASKIGAMYRGKLTREELEARKAVKEMPPQPPLQPAIDVTKIRSPTKEAERLLAEGKEEPAPEASAVKVQAAARGRIARRRSKSSDIGEVPTQPQPPPPEEDAADKVARDFLMYGSAALPADLHNAMIRQHYLEFPGRALTVTHPFRQEQGPWSVPSAEQNYEAERQQQQTSTTTRPQTAAVVADQPRLLRPQTSGAIGQESGRRPVSRSAALGPSASAGTLGVGPLGATRPPTRQQDPTHNSKIVDDFSSYLITRPPTRPSQSEVAEPPPHVMQRPIKIARPSAEDENEKIAIPSVTPWTHRGAGSAYELVTPAIVEPQPTTKPPPSSPGAAQRANRPGSATRIEVTAEPLSPPTIVEVQTPLRFSQSEGSIAPPNTELQGAKTEAKSPAAATEEATEEAAVEGTVEGTEVAIVVPSAQPATTTPAQQRDVGSAPRAAEIGFMEPTESQIMEKLHLAVGYWVVHLRTGHTIGFSVALYGPDGAKSRAMERARLDLLQEQGYTGDGKRLPPAKPGTAKAKLEGGGRVRTPASVPNQKRVTTAPTGQRASGSGQLVTQMAAKPMTPAALPLGVSSSLPTLATTVEEPAVTTTTEPSPTVTAAAKPAEAGLVSASQRSSSPPIRGGSPPPQMFQQDDPELQLGSSPAATAGSPQPAPVTEVVGTRVGAASPSTALLRATSPQMVVRVPSGGGADMPWDQTSPNAPAAAPCRHHTCCDKARHAGKGAGAGCCDTFSCRRGAIRRQSRCTRCSDAAGNGGAGYLGGGCLERGTDKA